MCIRDRPWTEALVRASASVDQSRADYVRELAPVFQSISERLLGSPATILYRRGWNRELTFAEAIRESSSRELRQKTTVVGPHRADLEIQWSDVLARRRVSRGQQKLLASALILAQISLRARSSACLLYTSPSPRDLSTSRMPSSA